MYSRWNMAYCTQEGILTLTPHRVASSWLNKVRNFLLNHLQEAGFFHQ